MTEDHLGRRGTRELERVAVGNGGEDPAVRVDIPPEPYEIAMATNRFGIRLSKVKGCSHCLVTAK